MNGGNFNIYPCSEQWVTVICSPGHRPSDYISLHFRKQVPKRIPDVRGYIQGPAGSRWQNWETSVALGVAG